MYIIYLFLIKGCKTGYGNEKAPPGVTRHAFPKDETLRARWIKSIPRENFNPAPSAVICSLHFVEADFKSDQNKKGNSQ